MKDDEGPQDMAVVRRSRQMLVLQAVDQGELEDTVAFDA